ncbi:MAG: hypothetical protein IJA85_05705 [Clostridia bacterium]|nr:hypothetical protein [Clostridia bacterium]
MKSIYGKIFALFLAALMICPLASCSDSSSVSTDETTTAITTTPAETELPAETREPLEIPDVTYDGYEFAVIARDNSGTWVTTDLVAEEQNGDPINDAVFKRNSTVSELLHITISARYEGDVISACRKEIQSGEDNYGAFLTNVGNSATLASEKGLVDLYTVEGLNLDKPWWDSSAAEDFSVANRLYAVMGDINITDNKATWTVLFNKKIALDNSMKNHYDVVSDGKWTLSYLHNNAKKITNDINGDGKYTPEDQWGAVNQYECVIALFTASGGYTADKDSNDIPYLSMGEQKMVDLLDAIMEFETDNMAQIRADDYVGKYSDIWTEVNVNTFLEGRALYYIAPLASLDKMRDMEDELGILPMPKNSENQENYYTTLQYNNATVYCIPATASDPERSGVILEAMAYHSSDLTNAYYEVTLKRKYTDDEESAEMLDLIFRNRHIDLGIMYNWGSLSSIYQNLPKSNGTFASKYASNEAKIKEAMQETLDLFFGN